MKKRNNLIIAGITGVAFILFVIFVYLPFSDKQKNLNKVKQSYQHSSFLKDSINHVPEFTCVDQNGKTFTRKDVAGKVFVAEFFYTDCEAYCPVTSRHLSYVQQSLNTAIDFKILSFSLNPDADSVATLKRYADMYKAKDNMWHFLRGEQEDIFALGEQGFFTIVKGGDGSFEGHSDKFALVDKTGNIRGFYKGTDSIQMHALLQDINYLVFKNETNE
jgi:protein SCO1